MVLLSKLLSTLNPINSMSGIAILHKELRDNSMNLLVRHNDLLHFVVTSASEESFQDVYIPANNRIKISCRDSAYESFKYEALVHLLLNHAQCANKQFIVQAFSDVDDTEILEAFIFVLNLYLGTAFSTERNGACLVVRNGEDVVFQTFM